MHMYVNTLNILNSNRRTFVGMIVIPTNVLRFRCFLAKCKAEKLA